MVDIFGQFVCGLKQSQSGSRSLSPDHAAAAIVIAARSSRVNIDSPLGTAVHTTELGPGMRLQMITSNNYSESKKLGIDTGWKTTISGDSDTEHTGQTLTPARTRSWRSCLLRMENVEEEAGSEVLGHVLGEREAAGCWREVWWKHPCWRMSGYLPPPGARPWSSLAVLAHAYKNCPFYFHSCFPVSNNYRRDARCPNVKVSIETPLGEEMRRSGRCLSDLWTMHHKVGSSNIMGLTSNLIQVW